MEENSENLKFQPLNEGLGFHPFGDGLPYSSEAKTPRTVARPLDTVAAGRPEFLLRPHAAVRENMIPRETKPLLFQRPGQPLLAKKQPQTETTVTPSVGLDLPLKRIAAWTIDTAFHFFVGMIGILLAGLQMSLPAEVLWNAETLVLGFLFLMVFSWALTTAQEIAFGTSVGKKLLGLRLEGNAVHLLFRSIFFVFSALFFGLGLIWCLFDRQRRCWHDLITQISPVESAEL